MARSTSEAVLVFDDRHPAVTYSGTWLQGGASGREYLNTTTLTTSPGASAAIDFYGMNHELSSTPHFLLYSHKIMFIRHRQLDNRTRHPLSILCEHHECDTRYIVLGR
jgi:hypothetical protein